jgi:5-methylcytosine-specific restriction enzyme subunit McrC
MSAGTVQSIRDAEIGQIDGIPIRNLWLLMLYASELFRATHLDRNTATEDNPDDIPDLVAEILTHAVEKRLKRDLSHGYQSEEGVLSRVRGRIDVLETMSKQLLFRGVVECRFEHFTVDTPRNQFIRAALESIARIVRRSDLTHRCRTLSICLERLGVSKRRPSRTEISTQRYGRHDASDRFMVEAARLAFDIVLPTEMMGRNRMHIPARDSHWVRRLYEKAVGGFYEVVLSPKGWRVDAGRRIGWPVEQKTDGIDGILPAMQTDIVLEHTGAGRRIVIDTKFTSILARGRFREAILKSGYLYQIYAYLRSQEGNGHPLSKHAAGLLLHPSIGEMLDETALIQGHAIRFATVDLAASAHEIRSQLLQVIDFPGDAFA